MTVDGSGEGDGDGVDGLSGGTGSTDRAGGEALPSNTAMLSLGNHAGRRSGRDMMFSLGRFGRSEEC
jgi:hypothetical protein